MENLLDKYLEAQGLTRYKVAKDTGVSKSTLARAADKDADHISLRIIRAISSLTTKTPGQVLDGLINLEGDNRMSEKVIIKPYYISKAEDFFTMVGAPNANPIPLAEWAQTAEPMQVALVTSDGSVVGHGAYYKVPNTDLSVPRVDANTVKKYGLDMNLLDMGLAAISSKLNKKVVVAKESEFHGQESHTARAGK